MRDIMNEKTSVKNRFGFRKLSVGLTTVFLGSIFFLSSGQPPHTAEVSANSNANGEATSNKDAKAHVTDSLIALNGPNGPEGVEKLG